MSAESKVWKSGLRVLVCCVLLGWIFHAIFLNEGKSFARQQGIAWESLSRWEQWQLGWRQGPRQLWRDLARIRPVAFGGSILLMGLTLVIGVVRWRMVLQVHGLGLPWGRAAEISLVAHFFNSFLLGSTGGDLIKAYYAARETHHKKAEAIVTVFVDRLMGLWAMLLFAGLMMLPNLRLLFEHQRLRPMAATILVMMIGCSLVAGLALRGGLSKGWAGARVWLRRLPKGELWERMLESCRRFGREPFFVTRMLGISMLLNVVCVWQVLVLSRGLDLPISARALFVIVPCIICLAALPITPSGLGVRENLFVFMLAAPAIKVPATSALSLSLLAYAGSLFWSLVGGVVYVLFKERHHLAEAELKVDPWPLNGSG